MIFIIFKLQANLEIASVKELLNQYKLSLLPELKQENISQDQTNLKDDLKQFLDAVSSNILKQKERCTEATHQVDLFRTSNFELQTDREEMTSEIELHKQSLHMFSDISFLQEKLRSIHNSHIEKPTENVSFEKIEFSDRGSGEGLAADCICLLCEKEKQLNIANETVASLLQKLKETEDVGDSVQNEVQQANECLSNSYPCSKENNEQENVREREKYELMIGDINANHAKEKENLEIQIDVLSRELQELQKKCEHVNEDDLVKQRDKIDNRMEKELHSLKNDHPETDLSWEDSKTSTVQRLQGSEITTNDTDGRLNELHEKIEVLEQNCKSLTTNLEDRVAENIVLMGTISQNIQEKNSLEEQMICLHNKVKESEEKSERLMCDVDIIGQKQEENENLKGLINSLEISFSEKELYWQEEKNSLRQKIEISENKISELTCQLEQISVLQKHCESLSRDLDEYAAKNNILSESCMSIAEEKTILEEQMKILNCRLMESEKLHETQLCDGELIDLKQKEIECLKDQLNTSAQQSSEKDSIWQGKEAGFVLQIQEFEKQKNEMRDKQSCLLENIAVLEQKCQLLTSDLESLVEKNIKQTEVCLQINKEKDNLEEQVNDLNMRLHETTKSYEDGVDAVNKQNDEILCLKEQLDSLSKDLSEKESIWQDKENISQQKAEHYENKLIELNNQQLELHEQITAYEKKCELLSRDLEENILKCSALTETLSQNVSEKNCLEERVEILNGQLNEVQKTYDNEINEIRNRLEKLADDYSATVQECNEMSSKCSSLVSNNESLEKEVISLRDLCKCHDDEMAEFAAERLNWQEQLKNAHHYSETLNANVGLPEAVQDVLQKSIDEVRELAENKVVELQSRNDSLHRLLSVWQGHIELLKSSLLDLQEQKRAIEDDLQTCRQFVITEESRHQDEIEKMEKNCTDEVCRLKAVISEKERELCNVNVLLVDARESFSKEIEHMKIKIDSLNDENLKLTSRMQDCEGEKKMIWRSD